MKATTVEIKVSSKRIDTCSLILIDAARLHERNAFMKHKPKSENERKLKELLTETMQMKISNFYCTENIQPLYKDKQQKINSFPCAIAYDEWESMRINLNPQYQAVLGTWHEYIAVLGILMKKLQIAGWSTDKLWHAICDDDEALRKYCETYGSSQNTTIQEICGLYRMIKHELFMRDCLVRDDSDGSKGYVGIHRTDYYSDCYYMKPFFVVKKMSR